MDLDVYGLRIFCQVMTDRSFSEAARSLRITQPTVSQQIGKLETMLGSKLFERVGHDIIPTQLAMDFKKMAIEIIDKVSEFESHVQNEKHSPEGLVSYAMPESCQWTPHYKKIMAQISKFPKIRFEIAILPNDLILKGLLEGIYDFGFVIGERVTPELRFQKFSDEVYSAVAANKKLFEPLDDSKIMSDIRLVTYPGWEAYAVTWAKGNGIWNKFKAHMAKPAVHVGTLAGAIHATQNGAGMAIIPKQCVEAELRDKSLFEWKSSKSIHPSHPVYLARRLGEKQSNRVQAVIDMLSEAKLSEGSL